MVLATLTFVACTPVPPAFGPDRPSAQENSSSLFTSLVNRFTNVTRSRQYEYARERIGRHALTPSVIYKDTAIWTFTASDGSKTLFGEATFANGTYSFTNNLTAAKHQSILNNPPPLKQLADGRHIMQLKELRRDEYHWFTQVDFAVGSLTPDDVLRIINTWLLSAEGRSGADMRAEYVKSFPQTTEALGRLFTLDSIVSVPDKDGANTLYIRTRFTPNGIRQPLPKFASYIDKYIMRINMHLALIDERRDTWFEATLREGILTFKVRSKDGHFAPFTGPPRTIPARLSLHVDMTAKVKIFTVGVNKLVGEFVNIQTPAHRGWSMRFTKEPQWQLPPVVRHLIRTPLKKPFEGNGSTFQIGFKEIPGSDQNILARQASTTVQESGILRFLGKLGGDAMGDFVAEAEPQENRFNATVFRALQNDFNKILGK